MHVPDNIFLEQLMLIIFNSLFEGDYVYLEKLFFHQFCSLFEGEYVADRNFGILPHDPFLDMTFPRPLRESLNKTLSCLNFFYFLLWFQVYFLGLFQFLISARLALVGGCGWPGDRAKDSNKKCNPVRSENKIRKRFFLVYKNAIW